MMKRLVVLAASAALLAACGIGRQAETPTTLRAIGSEDCETQRFVQLRTFQSASAVIGQPDFMSGERGGPAGSSDATVRHPAELGCGSLWIADLGAHRILRHPAPQPEFGSRANLVLGQPDFFAVESNVDSPTAATLTHPTAVVERDGMLFVCDSGPLRLLIWNSVPWVNGESANVVLGQSDFTSSSFAALPPPSAGNFYPADCAVAGGRLFVADLRGRVLIWNAIPTVNGTPADLVVGQENFTTCSDVPSATVLGSARSLWTDGTRLVVADGYNNRVLIWNRIPTGGITAGPLPGDDDLAPIGLAADVVLGQCGFTSSHAGVGPGAMWNPRSVDSNGIQLAVADSFNNRVLVWNTFPTKSCQPADLVLGQGDYNHRTANDADQDAVDDGLPGPRTLDGPAGVRFIGDRLYVSDSGNDRILVFESGQ